MEGVGGWVKKDSMKRIVKCLLLVMIAQQLQAQNGNPITTAVPYVRIAADARSAGMGDAGITASPDGAAIFWNSAKSLFAEKKMGMQLTYTSWFREVGAKDIYLLSTSGYKQLDEVSTLTGGIRYYSQGTINLTSANGDLLGMYRPRDWDISVGYNRKLNTKMGVGVSLRFINSSLGGGSTTSTGFHANSSAIAGDISFYYKGATDKGAGWNYGVTLSNLGAKMGYSGSASTDKDFLPANLGIGVSYGWVLDDRNSIKTSLEINKLLVPAWPVLTGVDSKDSANAAEYRKRTVVNSWFNSFSDGSGLLKSFSYSLGAEYNYNKQFAARMGYYTEDKDRGNRKYFTMGLSAFFKGGGVHLSYLVPTANSNRNVLSNTIRLGIVFE